MFSFLPEQILIYSLFKNFRLFWRKERDLRVSAVAQSIEGGSTA
jgi:hypothetical protein